MKLYSRGKKIPVANQKVSVTNVDARGKDMFSDRTMESSLYPTKEIPVKENSIAINDSFILGTPPVPPGLYFLCRSLTTNVPAPKTVVG